MAGPGQWGERGESGRIGGRRTPGGLQHFWEPPSGHKLQEYGWDSENRLKEASGDGATVRFLYDREGNRTVKRGVRGETLYAGRYFQLQNREEAAKHIFVGETRIATRLGDYRYDDMVYEEASLYFYHPDHLGSTTYVTDKGGAEYQHLEYTPYGESWIDEGTNKHLIGYRFTGKELDEETGLYYFGARYLDPEASMWLSADPAMGKYLPETPVNEEARKRNGNLPGMGGVFSPVNLALYHYAGNNPVKYEDPTGLEGQFFQNLWSRIWNFISPPRTTAASTPTAPSSAATNVQTAISGQQQSPRLSWPASGQVTSEYGPRAPIRTEAGTTSAFHVGIDIANAAGTAIVAASGGTVLEVGYQPEGYGYYVIIGHEASGWAGLTTRYAHMESLPTVARGQSVTAGQQIGAMGSTGMAEGSHLHFEVRVNNVAQNPRDYLE